MKKARTAKEKNVNNEIGIIFTSGHLTPWRRANKHIIAANIQESSHPYRHPIHAKNKKAPIVQISGAVHLPRGKRTVGTFSSDDD
jgi:hypothetical protein